MRTASEIAVGGQRASIKAQSLNTDLALLSLSVPLSSHNPVSMSFTPILGASYTVPAPTAREKPAQLKLLRVSFEILQTAGGRCPLLVLSDEKRRIRPGWSGAPVVSGSGKVVGVVAQVFGDVVHAVPATFVHRLQQLGDIPLAFVQGITTQPLTFAAARRAAAVADDDSGVRVARTARKCPVRVGDVLTSVNGAAVSNSGTIDWGGVEATWQAAVVDASPGEKVAVEVLRAGERVTEVVRLRDAREATGAAPWMESGVVMAGELVFAQLSFELLHGWGEEWLREAPADLVEVAMGEREEGVEEVVVLVGVVKGGAKGKGEWEGFRHLRVVKRDGERVTGLRDLVADGGEGGEMVVEFANGFVAAIPRGELVDMNFER